MNVTLSFVIIIFAVVIMLYAVWMITSFKKHISGGVVGKSWKKLASLVFLFAAGYIAMPFLGKLPPSSLYLVVSVIFLFGAVYVVMTIALIKRIILTLSE